MASNSIDEALLPIAILIDELKSDEPVRRLNSISRLGIIAQALGEERTRNELLPFLADNVDDEDEVLLAQAEQLGNFVPLVGGPQHGHLLLPLLESLSMVEETIVRDKAIESLNKIGAVLPDNSVCEDFVPVIKRLGRVEGWFTARVSACGLFSTAYPRCTLHIKAELRQLYHELCHDETPMVRRAAAQKLGGFAKTVEREFVSRELMPLFTDLTADEQDSVRLLAVEGCSAFSQALTRDDAFSLLLPIVHKFAQDKSWRVRYNVCNQLVTLCETLGAEVTRNEMSHHFVRLLRDSEAEVRVAAAGKVAAFSKLLTPPQVVTHIIPCVRELSTDTNQFVRVALASVAMELAPQLGKAATIDHLVPVFLTFLKDAFPDVRLHVISKLDQVNQVIGIDLLAQSLLPAIEELAEDKHWRVRLAVVERIPLLAAQLGSDFFQDKLGPQCMKSLEDQVASIREATTRTLQRVAQEFGPEWSREHLVPAVLRQVKNPHYLYRMTVLAAVAALAQHVSQDVICGTMLPVLVSAGRDRVPNVKFNVAKMLEKVISLVDRPVADSVIRPCLVELADDPDIDVRFYALQALHTCDNPGAFSGHH
uniref:TOG domain-containing protein n=1 Tax=Polytomella parva TaxID=51329 RepID=A0A7S0Y9B7_9CHLO|mmetsp:Transcript_15676/g.28050  ORF Transcript_15676/g.28050 Transcript_15676/m.28050 type:complete len:594 (+) Transcript_15676:222-2003(+)|eukprot:CAMPEP_0175080240 /NCGR_PEP_ID=MMETSP0052_2-20121109/25376_1 /TAXON_ID=51329 ORGANISM="Polytomella parva, Strain SAG 63-3" /NCGR_SAMPLE_ID=MMETSP0052_2 /ASSEMBLY_ACC=CAM_ASM_000194 /LENGTH=593 /DNA_ID=CAMNT_0016350875 /DNA_START=156 /DNA_END=1937 /DNA_ORIENTATION=+